MKKVVLALLTILALTATSHLVSPSVQAADADKGGIAYPHPYYLDEWTYGRKGDNRFSRYYLKAPVRLGSQATIQGKFGQGQHRVRKDYGAAHAEKAKGWTWITAEAYYNWYWF